LFERTKFLDPQAASGKRQAATPNGIRNAVQNGIPIVVQKAIYLVLVLPDVWQWALFERVGHLRRRPQAPRPRVRFSISD